MVEQRRVTRIAHAYGNSRAAVEVALASDADVIEADMWYRGGDLRIHHERRMRLFPLLIDKKMKTHKPGRYAVRIGKYYVRPDIGAQALDDLLTAVAGKKRLLLDVKGYYSAPHVDGYVDRLVSVLRRHGATDWVAVCGQTHPILERLRQVAPEMEVRDSLEKPYQWEHFLRVIERHESARQICMYHRFWDAGKQAFLEERDVDTYVWTVDDRDTAKELVARGVDGITSNNLELLAELHDWVPGRLRPSQAPADTPLSPSA
jgi:glycerophosphoryl diester phosphodiesterase